KGDPAAQGFSDHDGYIGMDARSGSVPGGASGFVSYHTGVGIDVGASSTESTMYAWSLIEQARYHCGARSIGLGGNATVEVGVELTVVDDTGVAVVSRPWTWDRIRVSGTETTLRQQGPLHMGIPPDLPELVTWTTQPGRDYTVNVGMWAFTDRSTGAGVA